MRDQGAGAVLVVADRGRLVGIFTRGDAVSRVLAEGKSPVETTLNQVMTPAPSVVRPATTAIEALRIMQDCGYRHLPVIAGRKVVGLVFRGDFKGLELDRIEEEAAIWEKI